MCTGISLFINVLVQQSSFYGYTSMLPTRYTQAVMAGESKNVMVKDFLGCNTT